MSTLLHDISVPENVRKIADVCPVSLKIYDNRVVVEGPKGMTYFFKDYTGVAIQNASILCAYSSVIFLNAVSANQTFKNDYPVLTDRNRILFSSGMFSYKLANEFAVEISQKIRLALENYKENPSDATATISNADEIKKYKELLDMGIISQEEFEAKKKQLLGL